MKDRIIHLTDTNFHDYVVKSGKLILVDFWADWCNPCKMIGPIFESVSEDAAYKEKLSFAKINIETHPNTAPKYNIRSIPTLLLFNQGVVSAKKVGMISKESLKSFLDTNINL